MSQGRIWGPIVLRNVLNGAQRLNGLNVLNSQEVL